MRYLSALRLELLGIEEIRALELSTSRPQGRVFEPFRFEDGGEVMEIPAGSLTDFATTPRVSWSLLPPTDPRYSPDAVIHDYGYRHGGYYPLADGSGFARPRTRAEVDRMFLDGMALHTNWVTRMVIYRAVRMFGGFSWQEGDEFMIEISKLQQVLKVSPVDGKAGPVTWRALAEWLGLKPGPELGLVALIKLVQAALGVMPDGVAGPITWDAVWARVMAPKAGYALLVDERSAKQIATLIPSAQVAARRWLLACLEAGLSVKIICGTRSYAEQDALYAQGRTKAGAVVTNARGGYSNHNFAIAWDFGVFGPKGEYIEDGPAYIRAGEIAEAQGLEWGGRWRSPVDRPHIQLKTGLTMAQMRERVAAGKAIV